MRSSLLIAIVLLPACVDDPELDTTELAITGTNVEPAVLAPAPGAQDLSAIAWDAQHGVFVIVWEDWSGTSADLRAARVTPAGVRLDPTGFAIATAPGDQLEPAIECPSVSGPCLVAWEDERSDGGGDLYGARLDGATVLDPGGVGISVGAATARHPDIECGTVGCSIVYEHSVAGGTIDVWSAVLSADGFIGDGPWVVGPGDQTSPQLVFMTPRPFVVYQSDQDGHDDLYYQDNLTVDGYVQQRKLLPTWSGDRRHPRFVPARDPDDAITTAGHSHVVFEDYAHGYAQVDDVPLLRVIEHQVCCLTGSVIVNRTLLLPGAATAVGPAGSYAPALVRVYEGLALAYTYGNTVEVRTLPDAPGDWWSGTSTTTGVDGAWSLAPGAGPTPRTALAFGRDGDDVTSDVWLRLGDDAPAIVSQAPATQHAAAIAGAATNLLVFEDDRAGSRDVLARRVTSAGAVLDAAPIVIARALREQARPVVAWIVDHWLVAWEDHRTGGSDIWAATVSTGAMVGVPFVVSSATGQTAPAIAALGSQALIAWQDGRTGTARIFAARVSGASVLDPAGVQVSDTTALQRNPAVAADAAGYLVIFEDTRRLAAGDLASHRVTTTGARAAGADVLVGSLAKTRARPSIAWSPAMSQFVAAWEERLGSASDIRGARLTPTGSLAASFDVAIGAYQETEPRIAWDGARTWVVWRDNRTAFADVYARSMGSLTEGAGAELRITDGAQTDLAPALRAQAGNDLLIVSEGSSPSWHLELRRWISGNVAISGGT